MYTKTRDGSGKFYSYCHFYFTGCGTQGGEEIKKGYIEHYCVTIGINLPRLKEKPPLFSLT